MGKNQQHKAMQRSRGGGEEGGPELASDEGADVSFHTPEWHAARIAALTTERMSWEDWKKLQKDNAAKAAKVAVEEEAKMREYRAQLDADRNARLSKGTNNAHLRVQVKDMKAKKSKQKKDKSKKEKKDKKSKNWKKEKKDRKVKRSSGSSSTSSDSESGGNGPVRLSEFLRH